MKDVLISVVVSTRNRCHRLPTAIEALLAQKTDGPSYEIVVVDNNSSDDTRTVVREFEKQSHGLVRYMFEGREGVSHGRNAGIAATRGPIVAFTDDDVRVGREWIAAAARRLMSSPSVQYLGGPVLPVWPREPPAWLTRAHWGPVASVDYGTDSFEVPAARAVCLISANLFVRRAALDRVGPFDPEFRRCQDGELMLRLWAAGLGGIYDPEVLVETIVPAERLTRRYHRRWHRTHGEFMARMPHRERRVGDRWIVEPSTLGRFFLGAPWFEYRALLSHMGMWTRCVATRRMTDAFTHESGIRYSVAFIAASMKQRAAHGHHQSPELRPHDVGEAPHCAVPRSQTLKHSYRPAYEREARTALPDATLSKGSAPPSPSGRLL